MIQRIQTIYLILIAGILLAMSFLAYSSSIEFTYRCMLTAVGGSMALLSIATIFFYKKRSQQISMCYYLLILLIATLGFIGYLYSIGAMGLNFIAAIPLIAIILDFLAIFGIKKDDKLVKSLNRLR